MDFSNQQPDPTIFPRFCGISTYARLNLLDDKSSNNNKSLNPAISSNREFDKICCLNDQTDID